MNEEENIPGEKPEVPGSAINDPAANSGENISLSHVNNEKEEPITDVAGNQDQSSLLKDVIPAKNILQPPTQNMEIHHHPHVHHSKKWKNYLYEFLMLFLAVTAGFLVENTRESYIEHHRANQFSRQLLADLRLDSAMFENRNRDIQNTQQGYDSLLYRLIKKSDATPKELLETLLPITYVFDVPATTTTYDQMKASGSLRYIENIELTAHLQHYYDVLLPRSIKLANATLDYFSLNINPFYLKHIRIQDYDPYNDTLINKDPVLLEWGTQTNQELANIMGGYRSLLKILLVTMNTPALQKIKETMTILKNEYDLL